MPDPKSEARWPLQRSRMAHLDLAARTRLRGLTGLSWITLDNDPRDIVLGPGDEFVLDAGGHAIACALRGDDAAELLVIS